VQSFGGYTKQFQHESTTCHCTMTFSIFFPPATSQKQQVPILYYLSGLSCTDRNAMEKVRRSRMLRDKATAYAAQINLCICTMSMAALIVDGCACVAVWIAAESCTAPDCCCDPRHKPARLGDLR